MSRHTCLPSSSSPFTPIKQLYQPSQSAAHGGASGSARPDRPRIPTSRWLRRCSTQSSPVQDAGGPRRKRRAWPQAKRNPHDGRRGDIQRRGQRPERLRRDRAKLFRGSIVQAEMGGNRFALCMACSRGVSGSVYPLCTMALWNSPPASGEAISDSTLRAPADSPNTVMFSGSPPNAAMLSRTHSGPGSDRAVRSYAPRALPPLQRRMSKSRGGRDGN